ncbi:MAG: GNAT superfamily N-acetyltransferase [Gammaproteobacteria bacterium]|jgi:GNAT superfamily N-acetyltransferase
MNDEDNVTRFPTSQAAHPAPADPLPRGKLEMVVTHLQMRARPPGLVMPQRAEALSIIRARRPTVSYYRYLYDTVGAEWMWFERRRLADRELAAIIHSPHVGIYVMYTSGVPAGFVELDWRREDEVEIAYFGLLPEFIGRGLGRYLLAWAIDKAFSSTPERPALRLWVHTCNYDHPEALANYQRAGFSAYRQERSVIDDPKLFSD